MKDKIIEISNINAEHLIRMQSKEKITDDMQVKSGEICLCSIGRFAYAKNFDHIPAIAKIKEKISILNGLLLDMVEMNNWFMTKSKSQEWKMK